MKRRQSLFGRVFLYTALFAILLVGMTAAVLLPQLFRYRSQARMYRVAVTFNEQFSELYPGEGFQRAAELFDFRQSFPFYITDQEGTILYQSRDAAEVALETSPRHITLPLDRQYVLHANREDVLVGDYREWMLQAVAVALAVFCAVSPAPTHLPGELSGPSSGWRRIPGKWPGWRKCRPLRNPGMSWAHWPGMSMECIGSCRRSWQRRTRQPSLSGIFSLRPPMN